MPLLTERYPSLQWIAPFAVFMLWLAVAPSLPFGQPWESIARVGVLVLVIALASGKFVRGLRVKHAMASIALGLAVCALWVAPDLLIPGWRSHWLFQNSITGTIKTSIAPAELADPLVLALRIARAAILVPILEELFSILTGEQTSHVDEASAKVCFDLDPPSMRSHSMLDIS